VDAVKLLARAHQTAIWERTRHTLRAEIRSSGVLVDRMGCLTRAGGILAGRLHAKAVGATVRAT
jgi:hypothetical protein